MNNTDDNRNLMFFMAICVVVLLGYQFFIIGPQEKTRAARQAQLAASSSAAVAAGLPVGSSTVTRDQALAQSPRVPIDTPSLKGSIALKGALLDDLYLVKYHTAVDPKSPYVELFRPAGTDHGYYVESGFNTQNLPNAPTASSLWTLTSGSVLSPGKPVVLTYDTGSGLKFTRKLSVDNDYMITEDDQVTNTAPAAISFAPYARVVRDDLPLTAAKGGYTLEGTMATVSTATDAKTGAGTHYNTLSKHYKDLAKDKDPPKGTSTGGWFAITDKYWMAAVIPDQHQAVNYGTFANTQGLVPQFQAGYALANTVTVAPGQTWQNQSHIFAGAKLDALLHTYMKTYDLPRFNWALDWGHLSFITIPFYLLLTWLYKMVGNFGIAILLLTVIVKVVFYPLAHNSYVTMTKMKHVQQHLAPKLDAIKKRYPDDMAKQQEATMQLYQEEKVNPMAGLGGCLPMLLQLPVFICLLKVLQLDIDLYHAPFYGYVHDLSAPDPLSIMNLFGLLPYDPATVPVIGGILNTTLHIGPVAILYGASMWLSQQMNPSAAGIDPMQKRMLAFMPLMMVFFFSSLAIGIMIYYLWSNILTMFQQYLIMRHLKVDNPIDDIIGKLTGKSNKKIAA
jgi:YidC/Oxa1 family membrane protein insertase